MAPLSSLLTASVLLAAASAFSPISTTTSSTVRQTTTTTSLNENFGFSFAEDQAENTPLSILGEANYKTWVNSVDPNNMLNRQVSSPSRAWKEGGRGKGGARPAPRKGSSPGPAEGGSSGEWGRGGAFFGATGRVRRSWKSPRAKGRERSSSPVWRMRSNVPY
jgi:hypothetical protein